MTIQRQYSLPNCTLVLEGISDSAASVGAVHPLLSMITSFQCHLVGQEKPLTGGRDLLNQLVATVSDYAQTFLSGISHRSGSADSAGTTSHRSGQSIQIAQLSPTHHRLLIQPQEVKADSPDAATAFQYDLTTVQLFDLVEAIDQMLADGQTLPDLALNLAPLPKRQAAIQKPAAQQTVPALLGVAGLAAAAAALFFVPIPEVRRPEPVPNATSQTQPGTSPSATPSPGSSPAASSSPASSPATSSTGSATASSTASSPEASPTEPSPGTSSNPSASASTSPGTETTSANAATNPAVEAILTSRPEITEPTELERLQVDLYDRLDRDWRTEPTFKEELIYRVGVSPSGEILGFKFANDPALNYVNETPLLDLRYPANAANSQEPIAQFRVVFKPDGVLEVSPWHGQSEPSSSPSP